MKWQNRGHEFDELGAWFQSHREIYIYTWEGEYVQAIADRLSFLGEKISFIDPVPEASSPRWRVRRWLDVRRGRFGKNTVLLSDVLRRSRGKLVLIPTGYAGPENILSRLEKNGFVLNKTVFWSEDFLRKYLPIYALYVKNKVYMQDISFIPSTKCNLNCAHCLNLTPYLKKMKDEPLEELKRQVDLFFSKVDYIGLFHVSGGEPILYPHLRELLAYIGEHYRGQIRQLATTTNGTQKFSDEICGTLREYDVQLICDDYTDTLPEYRDRFRELIEDLQRNGVHYVVNKADRWIDLAPDSTDHSRMSEEQLIEFCDACSVPWREYYGGRLYACNYAHYAEKAGLCVCDETEYIDFATMTRDQYRELIEFRAGYTEKGYVEFCKRCAGFGNNPYSRTPAIQTPRR